MKTSPMKQMKLNKFILLLFLTQLCFGQYQTTAKLKKVSESGFHEIILSPEIRSHSKQELSDIRIFDSKRNEVPYFFLNNKNIPSNIFQEYMIISKIAVPKKNTTVIIEITPQQKNNQLCLYIANSNSEKKYTISGSDDQKDWYGISDSQTFSDLNSREETYVVKTISYPLNTYRYLKIEFDDRKTLPVNVLKAGNFTIGIQADQFTEITAKKAITTENHSEKETQIHVLFDTPQSINKIVFEISKPTYYSRKAILYKKVKRELRRKSQIYDEEIISFELNSNTKNTFTIPELFERDFYIKIENQDNMPLTIAAVKYYQKPISIVADLNANEQYTIKTGNKNGTAPEYDLSSFKNKITTSLPQASIYDLKQVTAARKPIINKSFWEKPWFMWVCIVIGGIAILFFTASLVKDLKRKD